MNIYLDTNIFLYSTEPNSPFYPSCIQLIEYCQNHKIIISTSTETIQEIIHYSKNHKQFEKGLECANFTLELVDIMYSVNQETIKIYLQKSRVYKLSTSRDLLHLSSSLENQINYLITYDGGFSIFKEIKAITPEEFLRKLK